MPHTANAATETPANRSDEETKKKQGAGSQGTFEDIQRRLPVLRKLTATFRRIPPRWRLLCVVFWVLWKCVAAVLIVYVVKRSVVVAPPSQLQQQQQQPLKLLYIVTSLAEFDNGRRATVAGKDRLGTVLLPVLVDSVQSLVARPYHYQVDVYLILAYTLLPERLAMIRDRLPPQVGLQVWDDACPTGYDRKGDSPDRIQNNTRSLARQHRYVIKDKLPHYDLFLAFEDDMRVTAAHVQHFAQLSAQLDRLRHAAPETLAPNAVPETEPAHQSFFGPLTRQQLDRLIPGFVRVEVLVNETGTAGAQQELDPVALDYHFRDASGSSSERHFDPVPCCHVHMDPNTETPARPVVSDVVVWETNVKALSARQLPTAATTTALSSALDWVILLPGPGKRLSKNEFIGGYWSGRDGAFGAEPKPSPGMPDLIAQQGGWMATREQIYRLHTGLCQGAFVPPFDEPVYRKDGQESMNVEFFSGGYQFFTGVLGGCNMQRIVSMNPDHFSKHFIYHVANNKQRQLARRRMVRADHLLGQLNTVKKTAEKAKAAMQSSST
jgi:hypothetical protein